MLLRLHYTLQFCEWSMESTIVFYIKWWKRGQSAWKCSCLVVYFRCWFRSLNDCRSEAMATAPRLECCSWECGMAWFCYQMIWVSRSSASLLYQKLHALSSTLHPSSLFLLSLQIWYTMYTAWQPPQYRTVRSSADMPDSAQCAHKLRPIPVGQLPNAQAARNCRCWLWRLDEVIPSEHSHSTVDWYASKILQYLELT